MAYLQESDRSLPMQAMGCPYGAVSDYRDYYYRSFYQQNIKSEAKDITPQETLTRLMEEMDMELLELIRVEDQMRAISLKCREVRASVEAKSSAIQYVLRQMTDVHKQIKQKETQTDPEVVDCKNKFIGPSETSSPLPNVERLRTAPLMPSPSPIVSSLRPPNRRSGSFVVTKSANNLKELSGSSKKRFASLPALVKGYLTRRLLKTDKVQHCIKVIRDLKKLMDDGSRDNDQVLQNLCTPELKKNMKIINEIFFKYSKKDQMALIARKRESVLDQHFKNGVPITEKSYITFEAHGLNTSGISSATKKLLERKRNDKSSSSNAEPRPAKAARKCLSTKQLVNLSESPYISRSTRTSARRNATMTLAHKK